MKQILIIDDEEQIREMFIEMVSLDGYEAKGAENGKVAQELLEQTTFDLVITDLIMPEKEGFETIRDIRAKYESMPIIAMSGGGRLSPDIYLPTAKSFGADYVFQKPVKRQQLLEAIKNLIG
jgi:DNA-binding response OmpR family regulator